MVVPGKRPAGWKTPPLPREVTAPLPVLLPGEVRRQLAGLLGKTEGVSTMQESFDALTLKLDEIAKAGQARARSAWTKWWGSEASLACRDEDLEPLRDWIVLVFRRHLYEEVTHMLPLIEGSHGQLMVNPLSRELRSITGMIRQVEDRFGMSSLGRFRLHFEKEEGEDEDDEMTKAMKLARGGKTE